MSDTLAVGERGFYVLPQSVANGRPRPLYLEIDVINITDSRVIVLPVRGPQRNHRAVLPHKLVKVAPKGAWIQ